MNGAETYGLGQTVERRVVSLCLKLGIKPKTRTPPARRSNSQGRVSFPRARLGGGEEPGWNRPCSLDPLQSLNPCVGRSCTPFHALIGSFPQAPSSRLGFASVSHKPSLVSQIVARRRRRRRLTRFAASLLDQGGFPPALGTYPFFSAVGPGGRRTEAARELSGAPRRSVRYPRSAMSWMFKR